ncbi:MAG: hypothetical protein CMH98_03665 [Oceanospirillaceae bacterium]|nr:hypothetical protein [Oceanospirillaceae bacterium]
MAKRIRVAKTAHDKEMAFEHVNPQDRVFGHGRVCALINLSNPADSSAEPEGWFLPDGTVTSDSRVADQHARILHERYSTIIKKRIPFSRAQLRHRRLVASKDAAIQGQSFRLMDNYGGVRV